MAAGVRAKARTYVASARDLFTGLQVRAGVLGLDLESPTGRLATARESAALIERLAREDDDVTLAEILAGAHIAAQETVTARSLSAAAEVAAALAATQWTLLDALHGITDHRAEQAQAILGHLRSAAANDEHAQALAPVLTATVAAAAALLAKTRPPVIPAPRKGAVHGEATGDLEVVIAALTEAAGAHPPAPIAVCWVIAP
jgi:hypothetical protein